MDATYITVSDTAKLVRSALKRKFPTTKFSMRSSKYSMGSSIDVYWRDGPTDKMVSEITGKYASSTFDGMIDMKVSWTSWLLPDGSAIVAHNRGTLGSKGTVASEENERPHADAKLVRFACDYVTTHREMSPDFAARALASAERKHGKLDLNVQVNTFDGSAGFVGNDDNRQLAYAVARRFMSVRGEDQK